MPSKTVTETVQPERFVSPTVTQRIKRGWLERIKHFFTGADFDETAEQGRPAVGRLPLPLPRDVRAVAIGQLVANGALIATALGKALMFVVASIMAGDTDPGVLGRAFSLGISAILPFFFARGALRMLRGEPRGVDTTRIMATFTAILALGGSIAMACILAFGGINGRFDDFNFVRAALGVFTGCAFSLWSMKVLDRYKRELEDENFPDVDEL